MTDIVKILFGFLFIWYGSYRTLRRLKLRAKIYPDYEPPLDKRLNIQGAYV